MQASQRRCQCQVPVPVFTSIFDLFVTQQHIFVTQSDPRIENCNTRSDSTLVKLLGPQYRDQQSGFGQRTKKSFSAHFLELIVTNRIYL